MVWNNRNHKINTEEKSHNMKACENLGVTMAPCVLRFEYEMSLCVWKLGPQMVVKFPGEVESMGDMALLEQVGLWRLGLEITVWSCSPLPVLPRYEQYQL